ncbi:hypothetical protein ACMFMG_006692 [Clarireedia jacksonii]
MQFQSATALFLALLTLLTTTTFALPTTTPDTTPTTCVTNATSGSVTDSVTCISTYNTCMDAAAGDAGQITACSLALASCETAGNTKVKRTLLGLADAKSKLRGALSKIADAHGDDVVDAATTTTTTTTDTAILCADHHGGSAVGSVGCVGDFLACLKGAGGNAGTVTACSLALSACEVGVNTRA